MDWYLLDPLLETGDLPNLKRLIDKGVKSPLMTILPTSSPIIWNSIATGKTKEKHGIYGFATEINGEYQPFTSNLVRARTVWDLLNEGGFRTNVIGWWTTWPAQKLLGNMVSSYVSLNQRSWKGSVVDDVPNQTYPEELYAELKPLVAEAESVIPDRIERIFGPMDDKSISEATKSNYEDTKWCLLSDEIFRRAALYVQKKDPAQFFAVYLGGVDVIGHRFWKYMEPSAQKDYEVTKEEQARFGQVILDYYKLVDRFVGDFVALADEDTTVILASDHGMRAYPLSSNPFIAERSGAHDEAEPGVIILSGNNIRKGVKLKRPPSIYDIAPTVMYLMGMPVAKAMDGTVIFAAIKDEFKRRTPLQKKEFAGKPASEDGFIKSDSDAELIDRLRKLGYLK